VTVRIAATAALVRAAGFAFQANSQTAGRDVE